MPTIKSQIAKVPQLTSLTSSAWARFCSAQAQMAGFTSLKIVSYILRDGKRFPQLRKIWKGGVGRLGKVF